MSAIQSRKVVGPLAKLLVFAAITLVLTGLLANTLGPLWTDDGTEYRARFTDVTGVLPGDDVRIAGVRVGQVTGVKVAENTLAELTFTVDRQVRLAPSVHATIRYRNLVGQRYLALTEGAGGGGTLRAHDLIPLSRTTPALDLTVLFDGFRPLFTALTPQDVNSLAYEIIQVLQGEAGTVTGLLQHTASLTTALADRDAVIGQVITNLNDVLSTLDSKRDSLSDALLQLQQFVSGLAADRGAIGDAITNIGGLSAATAALLTDARPDLAHDIGGIRSLSGILNANTGVIDSTLSKLPGQYQALTRTASTGSWFNFFMCGFDGRVALPGAGAVTPATFTSQAASCRGAS
ncbi:MAG: ABC transporter substrate-binding protein [Actinobacteria bacterium 13_2_20CM_2_71_6]|nr:MAG: ABC transporter substrate-binding protein [Actinobacteria bacterium 13_2_20CM_2_71_6]